MQAIRLVGSYQFCRWEDAALFVGAYVGSKHSCAALGENRVLQPPNGHLRGVFRDFGAAPANFRRMDRGSD